MDNDHDRNMFSYICYGFVFMCILAITGGCFCGFAPSSNLDDPMFLTGFIWLIILAVVFIVWIGFIIYLIYDHYNTKRIYAEQDRARAERERKNKELTNKLDLAV